VLAGKTRRWRTLSGNKWLKRTLMEAACAAKLKSNSGDYFDKPNEEKTKNWLVKFAAGFNLLATYT